MNSSRRAGTTLIEILVVIVVLLVGILAIVQLFPGGFRVLASTQKNEIATTLGRKESERLKSHADQMPDAIVPVQYSWNAGQIIISAQPDRYPGDLGPSYNTMDIQGILYDAGNNPIGNWQYLTGANIGRRVLGEGRTIPTPRLIGPYYGSLLTLQFAPIVYNPVYLSIFEVYGNDMSKHAGDPVADNVPLRGASDYYVNQDDTTNAEVFLPQNPNKQTSFKIDVTVYDAGQRRDLIGLPAIVPQGNGWWRVPLGTTYDAGLQMIDYDSVRVARQFDDVSGLGPTDWGLGAGIPNPDPYEFKLLSPQLGLVLFNPSGYNYVIRGRGGRRTPLLGRVSYDVYDWRIIHDEFRMPAAYPSQYRLAIGSLKVAQEDGPDHLPNQGIGIQAPDSTGTPQNVDLVLQDVDSGGLFVFQEGTNDPTKTSFLVNKSIGLITFLDYDNDPSNGTQLQLLLPGNATPSVVTVNNRSLRALYMGRYEWAVQVLKPAAAYHETWSRPGIGEFYIGGSVSGDGANPARIYFPPADAGRVVSLGEIYYFNAGGFEVGPIPLTANLQTNNMDGTMGGGLPYVQVSDYFPDFNGFNYNYASAVKSVKGASVAVRVLWNPDFFSLTNDSPTNIDHLESWMQGWRRSTVETYLQRGN